MHSQGVIHEELVSSHIVLTKDRIPVIIDFETAKIFDGYFPDTEEDNERFASMYQEVMKECKAMRIPKRKKQNQQL